jgi:hypothetical protein
MKSLTTHHTPVIVFFHHSTAAYVGMGLTTEVYIQYTTFGRNIQVFPIAHRQFRNLWSMWQFQFSFESKITPRYLTWFYNLSSLSNGVGLIKPFKFRFMGNKIAVVLLGLTDSPTSSHQFWTRVKARFN